MHMLRRCSCGATYEVTPKARPIRENQALLCGVCAQPLIRIGSTRTYMFRLIAMPEQTAETPNAEAATFAQVAFARNR